jgi:hypothetical protein
MLPATGIELADEGGTALICSCMSLRVCVMVLVLTQAAQKKVDGTNVSYSTSMQAVLGHRSSVALDIALQQTNSIPFSSR